MSPGSASLPGPPLPVRLNGGIPPRPPPLLGHLPRLEPLLLRRLEHLRVPRLQGGAGAVGGAAGGQRAEGTIGGKGGKRSARFYGHTEEVRKSVACIYNLQACPYFLFFKVPFNQSFSFFLPGPPAHPRGPTTIEPAATEEAASTAPCPPPRGAGGRCCWGSGAAGAARRRQRPHPSR